MSEFIAVKIPDDISNQLAEQLSAGSDETVLLKLLIELAVRISEQSSKKISPVTEDDEVVYFQSANRDSVVVGYQVNDKTKLVSQIIIQNN
jgi:hypothetical protein